MPRSTLLGEVSFRYAAIRPKRGSSGACGTTSAVKAQGELADPMMCCEMLFSRDNGAEDKDRGGMLEQNILGDTGSNAPALKLRFHSHRFDKNYF